MSKQIVIANPRTGEAKRTSAVRANRLVRQGMAMFENGQLRLSDRSAGMRTRSDVYVNQRGVIFWNGARSVYIEGQDVAMFPPGCNVSFPKAWSSRALKRYTGLPAGQDRGAEMRSGRRG